MVRLPHFDVSHQVPPGAGVLDVRHRDHQVVERGALRLLSGAQLVGEGEEERSVSSENPRRS